LTVFIAPMEYCGSY